MASCESELALRPEKVNDVRRAPRFSLRALLAVLATVALALAIWVSFRVAQENKELRVENDQLRIKLRNEFGELEITDANRNKLQAISIPTLEPMTWKWRVYVPPGRTFMLWSEINGVSDSNLPQRGSGCSIGPGEQVVTIALRKDESKGTWNWVEKTGTTICGPILPPSLSKWIDRPSSIVERHAGATQVEMAETGMPLELLRFRSFPLPKDGGPTSLSGIGDGILVWIAEEKDDSK